MPCYEPRGNSDYYGPSYSDLREVKDRLAKVEAILCGVMRAISAGPHEENNLKILFARVDWEAAGITQAEAFCWWKEHVLKDRKENK